VVGPTVGHLRGIYRPAQSSKTEGQSRIE